MSDLVRTPIVVFLKRRLIYNIVDLIVLGLPSADDTLTLGVYMNKTDLRQCGIEQLVQRITDAFPELKDLLVKVDPAKVHVL